MKLRAQLDRENDGRWIADVESLPGVTCYGDTPQIALKRVEELARKVVNEQRLASGEKVERKLTVVVWQNPKWQTE